MSVFMYIPSTQFLVIVSSIVASGGLILGAQYLTNPTNPSADIAVVEESPVTADWKVALDEVQATAPGLPETPSRESVQKLLDEVRNSNLTDTVARSLLINLTSAGSQGLGNDIPTQDKIVGEAVKQVPQAPAKTYTKDDLTIIDDTSAALHAYGNKVMVTLGLHTGATSQATLLAMILATDNNDPKELATLDDIQAQYAALAKEIELTAVPKTLSPLHLQALNDFAIIAASFNDMRTVLTDPLRGLGGLQHYQSTLGEVGRMFTSIAETLNKNGILFDKSEPGAAWNVFISS